MGAQLNIKNAEAVELAAELAKAEGLTRTQVVLEALRARVRDRAKERTIQEVREICRRTAARMTPEQMAFDIDKELYDEKTGLPK